MQLDQAIRKLHRYVGLAAGVVLSVLGLSGSALVFRPELERVSRPDLFKVPVRVNRAPAAVSEMAALAAAAVPGLEMYRVVLPRDDSSSCEFLFGTGGKVAMRVYVDPYGPRILGMRASSDVFLWLQSLHFDLLAAETGRRINGGIAVALLALALSGFCLWVRSSAGWMARLRPRWRVRPARRYWGLHVAGGLWMSPFFLVMGSTATYFAFHEAVASFVCAITLSSPLRPPPRVQNAGKPVPLDELLRRAQALEPSGLFTLIRLPRSAGQTITFNYALPGDLSSLGANGIHFDPTTGAALRIDRLRDMPLGPRILAAFVPLHFGIFGGTSTRVLWVLLGLSPSLFFTTGLIMWRRRTSMRAAPPPAKSPAEDRYQSVLEVHPR